MTGIMARAGIILSRSITRKPAPAAEGDALKPVHFLDLRQMLFGKLLELSPARVQGFFHSPRFALPLRDFADGCVDEDSSGAYAQWDAPTYGGAGSRMADHRPTQARSFQGPCNQALPWRFFESLQLSNYHSQILAVLLPSSEEIVFAAKRSRPGKNRYRLSA
jgi:hypothetical protein